ncbi:hypothetical protein [Thalassomonas actiniarum]|uniref:Uncharacterized protein n=1 Tax=Thalassomonas actiniarum TaxID=485447 RepID=A0AAE9YNF5_9GAMM|nr:hypothetical protein [Thalassomonas actiniarum]WDD97876.1 hypothetical protein SG35_021670 [Thalassomonas actiniarum]
MKTLTAAELVRVTGASSGQKGDDPKIQSTPLQPAGAVPGKTLSQSNQELTP